MPNHARENWKRTPAPVLRHGSIWYQLLFMTGAQHLHIDQDRLLEDLRTLAGFGKLTTGVARVAYSDADTEARAWLRERMRQAGLETAVDGVGNVFGRTPGGRRAIVIGSHTDSVPVGGWLDGALGVVYGLEIARSVMERGLQDWIAVEAVSFMDEEGTYLPCVGSLSFCGEISADGIAAGHSLDGEPLGDAIARCGYADNRPVHADPGRHLAYLEAHIEQGPRLEAAGLAIGVVTGIVGIRRFRIEVTGEADHAGTVPMAMRKDAGHAAVLCAAALYREMAEAAGDDSVWNIGSIRFEPGADNVVPARAVMVLEMRDLSADVLDRMESAMSACLAATADQTGRPCEATQTLDVAPTAMDPGLMRHLEESASASGIASMHMPSGAGHDAMIVARRLPAAMLFIPSIRGKSHSEAENTDDADILGGCQVLASAVERISAAAV